MTIPAGGSAGSQEGSGEPQGVPRTIGGVPR
jgi:hypothetical protein